VSFDLARTVFNDPRLLTVADLEHSETDDRWFSVGTCTSGVILSTAYLWTLVSEAVVVIRLISARKAMKAEMLQYEGEL
jgi:hypothetical protein